MNSRKWIRLAIPTRCGRCGDLLGKGDPVLVIAMARARTGRALRFVRCAACEGPAPPDLPAFVERSTAIAPSALHRVGALLPFDRVDWKTRAAEREPGCDDD